MRATLCAVALATLGLCAPSALAVGHDLGGSGPTYGRSANPYWTPARMRAAQDLDTTTPSGRPDAQRGPAPKLRPTPRSSAGSNFNAARSIAPKPPTIGPLVRAPGINAPKYLSGEVPTIYYGTFPTSANGRLFFSFQGSDYACSGTSMSTRSNSVVLTAGHCVHDRKMGWAQNMIFVPQYRQGTAPAGVWGATFETAPRGWVRGGNFASDVGAIKVGPSPFGPLGALVGGEGLAWGQPRRQVYQAIGYPGNLADGEVMWTCISKSAGKDPYARGHGAADTGIGCNMGHGSSGGSWTIRNKNGTPFVNSVTSYGYDKFPNLLFGSYFTKKVPALLHRANRG